MENVGGSVTLVWKSGPAMVRARPNAATRPTVCKDPRFEELMKDAPPPPR